MVALWVRFAAIAVCFADSIAPARAPWSKIRYEIDTAGVTCPRVKELPPRLPPAVSVGIVLKPPNPFVPNPPLP